MIDQMKRAIAEKEKNMREQDAKRAQEDPNYVPKFKPTDEKPDTGFDLKKRLAEERKKHLPVDPLELDRKIEDEDLDDEDVDSDEYAAAEEDD